MSSTTITQPQMASVTICGSCQFMKEQYENMRQDVIRLTKENDGLRQKDEERPSDCSRCCIQTASCYRTNCCPYYTLTDGSTPFHKYGVTANLCPNAAIQYEKDCSFPCCCSLPAVGAFECVYHQLSWCLHGCPDCPG